MSQEQKRKELQYRKRKHLVLALAGGIVAVVLLVIAIGSAIRSFSDSEKEKDTEQKPQTEVSQVTKEEITCGSFSSYSGKYVEDGNDIPVENVAAMLVTNDSEEFLDLATLEYEINGREAIFVVTGLPPGKSAWVMEKNQMKISSGARFDFIKKTTAYKSEVVASTDKISLSADGYMLTAKNNTDEKLEGVFVYYKVRHTDGNYLGGITYMTTFGDLEPGESKTELAGHYDKATTDIVRIGWKEE